jgi:hypothetical protein
MTRNNCIGSSSYHHDSQQVLAASSRKVVFLPSSRSPAGVRSYIISGAGGQTWHSEALLKEI